LPLDRIDFQGSELLPERIAGALRRAIVESVLAPGERLQEQDLAKKLGVSRVPLREAFRVLAGEGLVVIQPHRGAVVSERSDSQLRELFAVRAMFESTAARLLAQSRPQTTLDLLDAMVREMKTAVKQRKMEEYSALAVRFHDRMVADCGNSLLGRLYRDIRTNLRRYQALMGELPGSPAQSIREHEKILGAIRAGNPARAAREAESHVGELVHRFEKRPAKPAAVAKKTTKRKKND